MRTRMTDILKSWGKLDDAKEARAVELHRRLGKRIGQVLVQLGFCRPGEVVNALAAQAGLSAVDLPRVVSSPDAVALVPRKVAERYRVVPLRLGGPDRDSLAVAIAAPVSLEALDAVRAVSRRKVVPFIADEDQLAPALARAYGEVPAPVELEDTLDGDADEAPPLVTMPLAACVDGV